MLRCARRPPRRKAGPKTHRCRRHLHHQNGRSRKPSRNQGMATVILQLPPRAITADLPRRKKSNPKAMHPRQIESHRTPGIPKQKNKKGCTVDRSLSVAFAVLLLAGVCVGQSSGSVEVFGGYSYMSQDFSLTVPNGVSGWNASATFKLARHLGFVADFGGYYPGLTGEGCGTCGQTAKIHTFLFGPQVSMTVGRVTPFARFLVGDSHVTTT